MKATKIEDTNYMALPGLLPGTIMFGDSKSAGHIIRVVCSHLDVTENEIVSMHRYRRLVEARQIAMFLIRKHTSRSLKDIAALFGGRDHTTAIHSIATVKDLCFSDETYRNTLLQIENKL